MVQHYLDQVNAILGRQEQVDVGDLRRHFQSQLLLPYSLLHDLSQDEFARLVEKLPVRSPLQVYASSTRTYPHGSAAAHVLGFVGVDEDVDADDFPDEDLKTFKMKGSSGRDGLDKRFDAELQGQAGGSVFRVDPGGFKINPPIETRLPLQGKSLTTSIDLDLQLTAERALGDQEGAAVALDVRTGEVLVLASKPDYDLNNFSPRLAPATVADIEQRGAWTDLATAGLFPPGSTFKTVVGIAGLRAGVFDPTGFTVDCEGRSRSAIAFSAATTATATTGWSPSPRPSPRAATPTFGPSASSSGKMPSPPRPGRCTWIGPPASNCPASPGA